LIRLKTITSPLLITLTLVCFGLSQTAKALLPAPSPDGGYPGGNTAEGINALHDVNTAVGINNTALGANALTHNTTGQQNTADGNRALNLNTTGFQNTAVGHRALEENTIGINNTAVGVVALLSNTVGENNTAMGSFALLLNTGNFNAASGSGALGINSTGFENTAMGTFALGNNTTGNDNTALGYLAGSNLTTGSENIDIGNQGVAGESNTIRIGTNGTHTNTYIAGIHGATIATGSPVLADSTGHLGTQESSERFKQNIKPMDKVSEAILRLKPVTFRYKQELDPHATPQFGLIAEEVARVNPDLVVRDENGEIYTVRYDAVNAMLLNEFLKEHRRVQDQETTIAQLKRGMDALVAHIKEQDSKIQRVSDRLDTSDAARQLAVSQY
jgi:hypothetical protein